MTVVVVWLGLGWRGGGWGGVGESRRWWWWLVGGGGCGGTVCIKGSFGRGGSICTHSVTVCVHLTVCVCVCRSWIFSLPAMKEGNWGKDEEMGGLDNGGQRERMRAERVTQKDRVRWNKKEWTRQKKWTFDRETKKGETECRGYTERREDGGVGSRPWTRGWMRGGTLKECQSDFQRVLFPFFVGYVWRWAL